MLLDANLLIYAVSATAPEHDVARTFVEAAFNGNERVGLPWATIGAFLRITTHPRITANPLTGAAAWAYVDGWLALPNVWVPAATAATAAVYAQLAGSVNITANLVPDAMLAALAIEHGLEVISTDADFARFPGVRWRNLLTQK